MYVNEIDVRREVKSVMYHNISDAKRSPKEVQKFNNCAATCAITLRFVHSCWSFSIRLGTWPDSANNEARIGTRL